MSFGIHSKDRLLAAGEEPALGAHLVTPRWGYAHHGVYVGGGMVVHYAGFVFQLRPAPVEEISLEQFSQRHPVWVRARRRGGWSSEEIVRRARSRLGEHRYRLLSNNCEHFAEWCVNGLHRSCQVDRLLARLATLTRAFSRIISSPEITPAGRRHSGH